MCIHAHMHTHALAHALALESASNALAAIKIKKINFGFLRNRAQLGQLLLNFDNVLRSLMDHVFAVVPEVYVFPAVLFSMLTHH